MEKEKIMQKIIDKQEDRIKLLNEFIELFDESETIENSFTTYYSLKDKLKLTDIETTNLKSQLAKADKREKEMEKRRENWYDPF